MEITSYNKEQLQALLNSSFYKQLDYVPISYIRGLSHVANPYADDDDILLWVIYAENKLIGYLGALPDKIAVNQKDIKIYWLSCLWIAPNFRGQGIKDKLLQEAISLYGETIAITNVLYFLEKPYQRLGIFHPTQNNFGTIFYLNPNFSALIFAKFPKLSILKPIYLLSENIVKAVLKIRKLFYKKVKPTVQIRYNLDADKELADFLTEFAPSSNKMVRPIEHFEWIASYPWMQSGNPTAESKKYYFSSVAKSFNYISCRLYSNGRLIGFCLLKERDKNLSVCYLYANEEDKPIFAKDILNWSIEQNMDTIFSMDETFTNYLLQNKRKFIYIKKIRRPYLLPKSKNISADIFQFGDGDVVFT